MTEQLAFHVYQHLRQHATHFIDIHTAFTADTRWALYAPAEGDQADVAHGMARAFGFPHTLPTPLGTLGGSAMTRTVDLAKVKLKIREASPCDSERNGAAFVISGAGRTAQSAANAINQLKAGGAKPAPALAAKLAAVPAKPQVAQIW